MTSTGSSGAGSWVDAAVTDIALLGLGVGALVIVRRARILHTRSGGAVDDHGSSQGGDG